MQKARITVGSRANVIGWRPLLCEAPFGKKGKDQRTPQTRNPNSQHSMSTSINSFHGILLCRGRVRFIKLVGGSYTSNYDNHVFMWGGFVFGR